MVTLTSCIRISHVATVLYLQQRTFRVECAEAVQEKGHLSADDCSTNTQRTTEDCTMCQIVAFFGQRSMELEGRGFIIAFHPLVNYGLNFCSDLRWPS